MAATTVAASGGWLTPREAFAEARNIVDLIRDGAGGHPVFPAPSHLKRVEISGIARAKRAART
jgi:hypothetical protein